MNFDENESRVNKLLRLGAATTSSVASSGIGFALGGPFGAMFGAASGPIITEVLGELTDYSMRVLSAREEKKVGALAYTALSRIQAKLDDGCIWRDDNFFQKDTTNSSKASVIFELALNKAKNEHQDKKIQLYANMFANICFTKDISLESADALLSMASNITYRQFCYLEFVRSNEEVDVRELRGKQQHSLELELFQGEEIQLHRNPLGTYGLLYGPRNEQLVDALSTTGVTFVELAETNKIESIDITNISFLISHY